MMKATPKSHLNTRGGFTLIELIMTIVVLGIVAVPFSLLLYEHVEAVFLSQDDIMALHLARYDIERMNKTAFDSIATATNSNYLGYPYTVTRTVTYAYGNSGSTEALKKIVVAVTKSGQSAVLASLTTYVVKNVQFGL